jgi:hypothetical protein
MHMQQLLEWLQQTALSEWLLNSAWAWPVLEILHFMGLSLLLGALIIFDLCLAGVITIVPVAALRPLPRLMIAGFAINFASGILFFTGDPGRYAINIGFQLKMLLVVIAGINAFWFLRRYGAALPGWQTRSDVPATARVLAVVSLLTWLGVLLLGRLIPYVGTG